MIQDISPYRFDNSFKVIPASSTDVVLHYVGDQVLLTNDHGALRLPTCADLSGQWPQVCSDSEYLFSIDNQGFFLMLEPRPTYPDDFEMHSTQIFRELAPAHMAFAGITGSQLFRWREGHKYCGKCGKPTRPSTRERALTCSACGHRIYPKISPAVIVAVTHGDRLLMAKSANGQYRRFALVAGFLEIGETLERAVEREVMEEVGLKVKNVRYYKSQPWGFSDSEMIGFFAELDGDPTISLQKTELAEARWFMRDEIPAPISSISIASEMVSLFKEGKA